MCPYYILFLIINHHYTALLRDFWDELYVSFLPDIHYSCMVQMKAGNTEEAV